MKEFLVRRAVEEDLDTMVEMWKELMDFHKALDGLFTRSEEGTENFRAFLKGHMNSEKACCVVAEAEGEIAGYCLAAVELYPPVLVRKECVEVFDMVVAEPYRRRGVGATLFKEIRRWSGEQGIDRIEVRVAVTNRLSTAFWRKMGLAPYLEVMFIET